jgi:hypothetical protein
MRKRKLGPDANKGRVTNTYLFRTSITVEYTKGNYVTSSFSPTATAYTFSYNVKSGGTSVTVDRVSHSLPLQLKRVAQQATPGQAVL